MSITPIQQGVFQVVCPWETGTLHEVNVYCTMCGTSLSVRVEEAVFLAELNDLAAAHRCTPDTGHVQMVTIAQAAVLTELDADLIRRWCISGQVDATKARGRWLITEDSLLDRFAALDGLIDLLVGAGGSLWRREGKVRVYFNGFWDWAGLVFPGKGGMPGVDAILDGKKISFSKGAGLVRYRVDKAFVDPAENALVIIHDGDIKSVGYQFDKDGRPHTLRLLHRLCAGFTKATGLGLGAPAAVQEFQRAGTRIPLLPVASTEES